MPQSASPPPPHQDALELAGEVAAVLEAYGLVACGRREGGVARVDVWTRDGHGYRYPVTGKEEIAAVVAACLELAQIPVQPPPRTPSLLS